MSNAKEKPALRISKQKDALRLELALTDMVRRTERAKAVVLASSATPDSDLIALLDTAPARMVLGLPAVVGAEDGVPVLARDRDKEGR